MVDLQKISSAIALMTLNPTSALGSSHMNRTLAPSARPVWSISNAPCIIKDNLISGAQKLARFIRENWKILGALIVAATVLIVGAGFLHGWEFCALHMAVGTGCGLVFGILSGVISAKLGSEKTPLTLLMNFKEKLHQTGVGEFVIQIGVTVSLLGLVFIPSGFGAALGILFGFHIANQAANGNDFEERLPPGRFQRRIDRLERNEVHAQRNETRVQNLEGEVSQLKKQLDLMQRQYATMMNQFGHKELPVE